MVDLGMLEGLDAISKLIHLASSLRRNDVSKWPISLGDWTAAANAAIAEVEKKSNESVDVQRLRRAIERLSKSGDVRFASAGSGCVEVTEQNFYEDFAEASAANFDQLTKANSAAEKT